MNCRSLTLGSLLMLLVVPTMLRAQEPVRHFPQFHCRYTLPGEGWTWLDVQDGKALFLAQRDDGIVVTLGATKAPRSMQFDSKFLSDAKKACILPGKVEMRNERTLEFLGLPCYQIGCQMPDGRTSASRAFLAHGNYYHVGVVGDLDPVESRSDFESIMGGFAFDVDPGNSTTSSSSGDPEDKLSEAVGKCVGYGLFVLMLVVAGRLLGLLKARRSRVR